jgi:hypothetical protein
MDQLNVLGVICMVCTVSTYIHAELGDDQSKQALGVHTYSNKSSKYRYLDHGPIHIGPCL